MSTPVTTDKWAGSYDCSQCRRKRLTASEFSKKAIEKHRAALDEPMKCKSCVEAAAQAERDAAQARRAVEGLTITAVAGTSADGGGTSSGGGGGGGGGAAATPEQHECSACSRKLPAAAFSRSNLSKGPGKQRCSECVAAAEKANLEKGDKAAQEKLAAAKAVAAKAEASGTAAEKLAAFSVVAALEAEQVTGLKPVVLGRGRGGKGRHGGRFGRGGR